MDEPVDVGARVVVGGETLKACRFGCQSNVMSMAMGNGGTGGTPGGCGGVGAGISFERMDITDAGLAPSRPVTCWMISLAADPGAGDQEQGAGRELTGRRQPEPLGGRGRHHAIGDAELGEDVRDVYAGGVLADEQGLGDFLVPSPARSSRKT